MAIVKARARQSTSISQRVSEGAEQFIRSLRDGSLVSADWKMAAIMQGLGYMINVGAFSTPITGGGNGTIIDQDQPEFVVSVPDGTSIIPIRIEIVVLPGNFATEDDETETLIAVDQDTTGVTGATDTDETIYNMSTLCGNASQCTATSATSGNITTAPVLDLELSHTLAIADTDGTEANFQVIQHRNLYEPKAPPVLNGPCNLIGYWGGTVACEGFACVQWIEFPSAFTDL